jgi:putative hydrolase of the HAD superfamily
MRSPVAVAVLDLGGVACRYLPDRRLQVLAALTGRPPADVHAALWASGLDGRAERGELGHAETYDLMLDRLGGATSGRQLRAAWAAAFEPDLGVLDLVAAADCPTVLFSNNGPIVDDCLANELSPVVSAFDRSLLSWRLGATKPDLGAFATVTSWLGVAASAVLFVDDSLDNVRAAARCGWLSHPYRGVAKLRLLFEAHGLVPPV